MSNREQVQQIIDAMPEYQITGLLAFLRAFGDTPNDETATAIRETDEAIRTGAGQHFKGSTADFFALLGAEG